MKEKQKLARQKEVAKKRKLEAKKGNPKKNERSVEHEMIKENKKSVKFEERNSRKSLCVELNKVIDASDVILEVVDARDPLGHRCPQVEQAVLQSEEKKQLILVINKIDLVPKGNAEKWLKYLGHEFPTIAFKSSTQLQDRTMAQKNCKVNSAMEIFHSNACAGDENLLRFLGSYCRNQHLKRIKVGVVGFPNVGKSSIINSLKKMRVCNVGQIKGLTKSLQEVHIDKQIKLLDSPSIIASPSNSAIALALRKAVDIDALENPITVVELLLKDCEKQQVTLQYNIPDFQTPLEFLMLLAQKRGMLKKGTPDLEKAAKQILHDWTGTKISYHTYPPEITEKFVDEAKRDFNVAQLMKANMNTLKVVRCPNAASSIVFKSTGPTNGLLAEGNSEDLQDMEEEKDEQISEVEYVEDEDTFELVKANKCPVVKHFQEKQMEIQRESEKKDLQNQKHVNIGICERSMEDAYDFNTDYV
ncbi:guanine nucleotide-binding protein-like 3 isoform X2 [Narcine bancroftii]